jgi:uncharacterized protein (TIGR02117 family)
MKVILKLFRYLLKTLLLLISVVIIYLLAVVVFTFIPVNSNYLPPEKGIEIYIISNGVHTDIALPVIYDSLDWKDIIPLADFEPGNKEFSYIAFGWGDKGFYLETPTWADLKTSVAIKAMLLPSPTAMHVSYYEKIPPLGEKVKKIIVSKEQMNEIIKNIKESFQYNANGKVMLIDCCRYEGLNDSFYEATGSYHLVKTCNEWTNRILKKAGIKTALWAPFEPCLMYYR